MTAYLVDTLRDAHVHSSYNREEIDHSDTCGCYYCLRIFGADRVIMWADEGQTAICPCCSSEK